MWLKLGLQLCFLKTRLQVSAYSCVSKNIAVGLNLIAAVTKTWLKVKSLAAVTKTQLQAYCCGVQGAFVNAALPYSCFFLGSIAAFFKCSLKPIFLQCLVNSKSKATKRNLCRTLFSKFLFESNQCQEGQEISLQKMTKSV